MFDTCEELRWFNQESPCPELIPKNLIKLSSRFSEDTNCLSFREKSGSQTSGMYLGKLPRPIDHQQHLHQSAEAI